MINDEKYLKLIQCLKEMGNVIVAFSGGVDSTFLLKVAKDALGDRVKAVTIQSPYIPEWEIEEAKQLVSQLGIEHEIIKAPVIDEIKQNPENRCYLCKKALFQKIKLVAQAQGFHHVADGTNYDDRGDYRPGLKALQELDIRSPLMECELTKQDIRAYSQKLGLSTWDKPAYACLLTRIPYGTELREEDFIKIEKAEKYLMDCGIKAVRVRCHDNLARIEVAKKDLSRMFQEEMLEGIAGELKRLGFQYVTLDVEGYRTGSFNETIER